MAGGPLWTAAEHEEMRRLAAAGLERAEIAEKLGRPLDAVTVRLRSAGFKKRPAKRPFTYEEEAVILELKAQGLGWKEIGQRVGRWPAVVAKRMRLIAEQHPCRLDRRADDEAPPERPLRLLQPQAMAIRKFLGTDPRALPDVDRQTVRRLARVIRAADLVEVEGLDEPLELLGPLLELADRVERVIRTE